MNQTLHGRQCWALVLLLLTAKVGSELLFPEFWR